MKYYKLSMDMERENDIVCHYQNDYGIQQNALNVGKVFDGWDDRFEFLYTKEEGDVWTDQQNIKNRGNKLSKIPLTILKRPCYSGTHQGV